LYRSRQTPNAIDRLHKFASTSLHLFDELFRFFEAAAGCLPVKLYRLNFSIGTQLGHVSKGIEFDIRPLVA
jgi:hypothetical protein